MKEARLKQVENRRANQRGSAMLIVFVFAAIVAIGLFTEMPVIIFEAQRNKEQLLVDRGNEYVQAVKLYRRKTGQFPPNLDALEKTNQVRFLRKKFVDPFTDKADWRLLHAGPNGTLTDSKIKVAQTVTGAGNSALGTFNNGTTQNSPFGASTPGNTGFGNSNSAFNNSPSSGFGGTSGAGFGAVASSPNNAPGGQPNSANSNQFASQNAPAVQYEGGLPVQPLPNPDGTVPIGRKTAGARTAIPNGTNGTATAVVDGSQTNSSFAPSSGGGQSANEGNPNAAVGSLMNNPNPTAAQSGGGFNSSSGANSPFGSNSNANSPFGSNSNANSPFGSNSNANSPFGSNSNNSNSPFGSNNNSNSPFSSNNSNSAFGTNNSNSAFGNNAGSNSSSGFGTLQSGGLAGVASKVERHSIKVVNDQHDYSLWEFYYDQTKDPANNVAVPGGQNPSATGQPGNSPMQSGFGQSNGTNGQSSPFGQSGTFGNQNGGSAFGGNNSFGSSNAFGSSSGSAFPNGNGQNNGANQQQTVTPPATQPPPQ